MAMMMMTKVFVDAHQVAQVMSKLQAQTSNFGVIGLQDLGSVARVASQQIRYSVFTIRHSVSWIGIIWSSMVSAAVTLTAGPTVLQMYCDGHWGE